MENHQNNEVFQALAREGVLITTTVSYWRGHKKLKPEEVGLEPSKISDRLVCLGHKRLLPRECFEKLSLIEGRVHAYIEQNTFPFLGGLAHFLPNAKLEEVTTRLKELEVEFYNAKELFIACYSQWRETAIVEWKAMIDKLGLFNGDEVVAAIEASRFGRRNTPSPPARQEQRHQRKGHARREQHGDKGIRIVVSGHGLRVQVCGRKLTSVPGSVKRCADGSTTTQTSIPPDQPARASARARRWPAASWWR